MLESQAELDKKQLVAASFTAWQVGRFNGLKMPWYEYCTGLGLSDAEKTKQDDAEYKKAIGRIAKKMGVVI